MTYKQRCSGIESMRTIIVEKRWDDYIAYLEGHREIWGCGEDFDSAVGDLVRAHEKEFDIEIRYAVIKLEDGEKK